MLFDEFTIIGHRGAAGLRLENTMGSIQAAIKCAVSWIEFDVQRVEDSLVLFHDDRLERITDGIGWTLQLSLSQLRSLKIGESERIPFFEEVLSECRGKVGVNIEIKSPQCAELVGKLLLSHQWPVDAVLVSSFLHSELEAFRAMFGFTYHVAPIIKGELLDISAVCADLRPVCIVNEYSCLTGNFIRNAKALGLGVLAYTVNYPDKMLELRANGVDGVFSDFPDRMLAELSAIPD
jgi:glycerophosphoryl diester phosphodiesterase